MSIDDGSRASRVKPVVERLPQDSASFCLASTVSRDEAVVSRDEGVASHGVVPRDSGMLISRRGDELLLHVDDDVSLRYGPHIAKGDSVARYANMSSAAEVDVEPHSSVFDVRADIHAEQISGCGLDDFASPWSPPRASNRTPPVPPYMFEYRSHGSDAGDTDLDFDRLLEVRAPLPFKPNVERSASHAVSVRLKASTVRSHASQVLGEAFAGFAHVLREAMQDTRKAMQESHKAIRDSREEVRTYERQLAQQRVQLAGAEAEKRLLTMQFRLQKVDEEKKTLQRQLDAGIDAPTHPVRTVDAAVVDVSVRPTPSPERATRVDAADSILGNLSFVSETGEREEGIKFANVFDDLPLNATSHVDTVGATATDTNVPPCTTWASGPSVPNFGRPRMVPTQVNSMYNVTPSVVASGSLMASRPVISKPIVDSDMPPSLTYVTSQSMPPSATLFGSVTVQPPTVVRNDNISSNALLSALPSVPVGPVASVVPGASMLANSSSIVPPASVVVAPAVVQSGLGQAMPTDLSLTSTDASTVVSVAAPPCSVSSAQTSIATTNAGPSTVVVRQLQPLRPYSGTTPWKSFREYFYRVCRANSWQTEEEKLT